jgi:outer membrane receptor protein involved in Fe transport
LVRFVHEPGPGRHLEATAWAAHYALDLYSNFTFDLSDWDDDSPCLADPPTCAGDGIVQSDDRVYGGGSLVYRHQLDWKMPTVLSAGLDTRTDYASVRLDTQTRRDRTGTVAHDQVLVSSLALFASAVVLRTDWSRFVGCLRGEGFRYDVDDDCDSECIVDPVEPDQSEQGEGTETDAIALPKANLILSPFAANGPLPLEWAALREGQLFLNWGIGFHSNDARDVVAQPNEPTLPQAMGWEVGWRMPVVQWLDVSVAYWWLDLEREFVFVGDEGTTEVRPRSRRHGVELLARAQPWEWLEGEMSLAWSDATYAVDDPELGIHDGDPVAQAPGLVAKARLRASHRMGLAAELNFRALGARHALDTQQSPHLSDYAVFDFGLRYRRGPLEASVYVENVFDTQWRSAEFFFESFIAGFDAAAQEDFHFVPGNPRNVRVGLTWYLP